MENAVLKLNTCTPIVILPDGSSKKFNDVITALAWCDKNGIKCRLSY